VGLCDQTLEITGALAIRRHSSAQRRHACAQAWQCACECFAHSALHASQMSAHKSQIVPAYLLSRAM
jgi:hypothetical protein